MSKKTLTLIMNDEKARSPEKLSNLRDNITPMFAFWET